MRSAIKCFGGQFYQAKQIAELLPPARTYKHYCEPFFGSGAVLFAKGPQGHSECVNDIYGHLANFWRVVASEKHFASFHRHVQAVPISEEDFRFHFECLRYIDTDGRPSPAEPDLARAVSFFVVNRQSLSEMGKDFTPLSRNRTRSEMNEQASAWISAVNILPEFYDRMRPVVILNRDFEEAIRSQDGPKVVQYLDPPYMASSRTTKTVYAHEMSEDDHERLIRLIAYSGLKSRFILTHAESSFYTKKLIKAGWNCVRISNTNHAGVGEVKNTKITVVWRNYR